MQLFGTDLLKTYWAHDAEMTSMRRRYVASMSLRRHVPAGNLAPLAPPNILNLAPPPPPPPQYSKPSYAFAYQESITSLMITYSRVGRKAPEIDPIKSKISFKTSRGKKESTNRHHHRHHQRQPGEQHFPIQVVTS